MDQAPPLQPDHKIVYRDRSDLSRPEEWRKIPGFPDFYEASSWGRIRALGRVIERRDRVGRHGYSTLKTRVLKGCLGSNGYYTVLLPDPETGKLRHFVVNRLVFSAFYRRPRQDEEIDHDDNVRGNNAPYNLRPLSVSQNRDKRLVAKGERHGSSKLTKKDVLKICSDSTSTQVCLAAEFNVSRALIGMIQNNKIWRHI